MAVRASALPVLLVALLATQPACAQQSLSQPALSPESVVESAASAQVEPAQSPIKPMPLQSAASATTSSLVTVEESAALAAAVAGTCTVIDALLLDICLQTPDEDYCRR